MSKERIAQVWPEWEIEEQLGKGSYGTVYKAVRKDNNIQSHAAIKVISIPTDSSEIDSLRSEGLSLEGAKTYFQGIVNDFVGEIQLMESLKGVQNIVSVEDYKVIERTEEIGWDIYIRMELLTPFNSYIRDHQMSEKDVIKLGVDICTALEICSKRDIVHRDIKPENIFINDFGYFKLGDFGIARKLENSTGGLSQKGTFNYMAPEVATGTRYDARVDLYSLGIVLYRLLNGNKLPFIETEQQLLNPNERKAAVERRIRGERFAPPGNASPQVAAVIMRACTYNPAARFANATEMKDALTRAGMGMYVVPQPVDMDQTVSVRHAANTVNQTVNQRNGQNGHYAQVQRPNNTVPPQYMNHTTPPMNGTTPPMNRTTPPMNGTTPPMNGTTPPMNRTTPPMNGTIPPMNRTTPPFGHPGTYNGSVQVQQRVAPPAPAKKLNVLHIVGFGLIILALIMLLGCTGLEAEEDRFNLWGGTAMVAGASILMTVLGAAKATKEGVNSKGIALVFIVLAEIIVCISLDNVCVAAEDLEMLEEGMDIIFSVICCIATAAAAATAFFLATKKKN